MSNVLVTIPYEGRWYFDSVVTGVLAGLDRLQLRAVLSVHRPESDGSGAVDARLAVDLRAPETVGAVLVGFRGPFAEAYGFEKPAVAVGGSTDLAHVMIDDVAAARIATEHLIQLGHRRIAHLAGSLTDQMDFSVHAQRDAGYRAAMTAAGLGDLIEVVACDFDADEAARATRTLLLSARPPTAIFAVSDEIALAVLRAAEETGVVVPGRLSVVGIDDHPDADPAGLTTVRQNPYRLGELAVELLDDLLRDGESAPPAARTAAVALVRRSSRAELTRPTTTARPTCRRQRSRRRLPAGSRSSRRTPSR